MRKNDHLHASVTTASLDLLIQDIEAYRAKIEALATVFPRDLRKAMQTLDTVATPHSLLDGVYEEMLPMLRGIHARSKAKAFTSSVADTYMLSKDEAAIVTEALRNTRIQKLLIGYIAQQTTSLTASSRRETEEALHTAFHEKTAPEITELIEQYAAFKAYTATAQHCLVTYVDSTSSRREQRKARRQIAREQKHYSTSIKGHRENVVYRMEQISRIYNGLTDELVSQDVDPAELVTIAAAYDKRARSARRPSLQLAALQKVLTPLSEKLIDRQANSATLHDSIRFNLSLAETCAKVIALSPIQREFLPAITEEYRTLALDYSRIRSKNSSFAIRSNAL